MSAITWNDVTAAATTLTDVAEAERVMILEYVNARFVPGVGTEDSTAVKTARIYLARHMGTAIRLGSASGPVVSESEGGLSRTYAVMNVGHASMWQQTVWGQLLTSILSASPARAGVILGC